MSSTLKDIQYQYYDSLVSLITPIRDEIYYGGRFENHDYASRAKYNNMLTEALNIYTNMVVNCKDKEDTYIALKICMSHIYGIIFNNKMV